MKALVQQRLLAGLEGVGKHADLAMAAVVVAIIFMMILPLPLWVVDTLIALNMTLAAVLLMVAMYLPSPLAFSSFPSVLLITTLFRLGISVATTRLILLQADAGHIIYTFGNFVVGGNLVVGLVVFLIITIVQFIVITKGAERVAEVGARFSLDAMPGKQMSIDGDLRAGTIDMEEAKRRRTAVEKESQLYGAMDGAMKFVKGDAIAGLVIVAVNLLGGMLVGVLQRGMPAGKAMQTYSVLTIGDGLIAQIPALCISICAGLIVTRVTGTDGPGNVGQDVGRQILGYPKALLIGAAIAVGMAAVPGMPWPVFLILAAGIGGVGFVQLRRARAGERKKPHDLDDMPGLQPAVAPEMRMKSDPGEEFVPMAPLLLEVASGLRQSFDPQTLNDELLRIRRALYVDLGVPFPGIGLRFSDAQSADHYRILLSEVPVSQGRLRKGHVLVRETAANLEALGLEFETDRDFLPGMPTLWMKAELRPALEEAGIASLDANQVLARHLGSLLRRHASEFIGIQETRFLLSKMEARFPDLVKELLRIMPVQKVAEILQRLVSEDISVRNLRAVLESLIDWGQKEKDSVLLTEYVRSTLKRYISHKYSGKQGVLLAYVLSQPLEEKVRTSVRQTSAGSYLALEPEASRHLLASIKRTVGEMPGRGQRPVLLTSMDVRRYIRKLIEQDVYDVPVLSYQELSPDVNVQALAKVEL